MNGPIAIVGMGGRFPGSPTLAAYWDTIRLGRVCAAPVARERWRHENFYSPNGAREANRTYAQKMAAVEDVRSFAPEFFGLTPRRAKVMDPQQRLFLEAVRTALEDGGYATRAFPRARTGVFVGATVSDFMDVVTARVRSWQLAAGEFGAEAAMTEEARQALTEALVPMQAYSMVGSLLNMVAANVNQCFDFGGPSFTMDAACSSALVALHEGVWQLRAGLIDAAVVGGVYLSFSPDNFVAFARIGALSASDACRPYDGRADGFVIGEGVGAVILRRLEDAQAAGDRIYAVIRGIASNSDGKSEGPMTPRREGQLMALENAYRDAGFSARTLGYLEGHGTATPVGDATEIAAFRDALGGSSGGCAIGSVKANIGHSMSAAGIAGVIKASLALLHRKIPPQANYGVPRPELELDRAGLYVPREMSDWSNPGSHPRRAGINGFGFGGTNVHVVLEEPAERRRVSVAVARDLRGSSDPLPTSPALRAGEEGSAPPPARSDGGGWEGVSLVKGSLLAELIVLSAPSPALLKKAADELAASLANLEPGVTLRDVAYTLALRRPDDARLAVVATDLDDLAAKLREATAAPAALPAADRKIAFLFPGQGLQTPGMCADLYQRFPAFRAQLDRLAGAVALPRPLLSYLYPEADSPEAAAALTATEVCQPAVAALGLAVCRFVEALGVVPDLTIGHSLGEFAAAAGGGLVADDAACVRFVAERGRIIAASTGEPGTMAAAAADAPTVERALAGLDGVVLANLNHPRQSVISGTEAGVAEGERRLAAAGLRTTRLRVSHAFHSPLMSGVAQELAPAVEALPLSPARVPVISAIRPGPYPADPRECRRIFLAHATSRVDFAGALSAAARRGARVFLQMGAGTALSGMATATLEPRPFSLTLAGAAPDGGATFLRALGELWLLGAPVELGRLFDGQPVQLVSMLPPSLLDARPLWPVAARDAVSRPPVAVSVVPRTAPLDLRREPMDSKPVKTSPTVPTPADPAGDSSLAALFRQQMAVLEANVAIIRQQNELLSRGGSAPPPVEIARIPAPDLLPEVPLPHSNGNGNGNGHALRAGETNGNGNGHGPARVKGNGGAPLSAREHRPEAPRVEPAAPGPSQADIEAKVIGVVSRITAHPPERLKPSTRLGADLGFDSLMTVELVSGVQEAMPETEPLSRAVFAEDVSIADLARHLARGVRAGAHARKPAPRPARTEEIKRYAVAFEPKPLATPGAALPRPPVLIVAERPGGPAEALRRRLERGNVVARVASEPPDDLPAGATVIDLRALGDQGALPDAASFTATALRAFALARQLDGARPSTLVFAHSGPAALGLAGLAKSLGREWPESRVLAVEMEAAATLDVVAERLLAEIGGGETAAEVRYSGGQRLVPVLRPAPLSTTGSLPAGAVVAITGGGTGLGARLARALAHHCKARLVLLGRRAVTPELEQLVADARAAGGDALYLSCDVRDAAAVAAALAEGRRAFGPIQVAVHAAGLVEDAPVGRKQPDAFARVFDTKVAGALALWRALAEDPLTVFLMYGSWAGRFGNAHQVDYSAANQALARLAELLPATRPGVRVGTLDLPAWEGSTMIAGLPEAVRVEMRARGVSFLNDEVGLERVLAELAQPGAPSGEALLGAQLPARTIPVALRTHLSQQTHPYLDDHRIGERPVLPMAAAVDLLVAAARGTGTLGEGVVAVADLAVVKGVILAGGAAEVVARASAEERGTEIGEATAELLLVGPKAAIAYRARIGRASGWLEPVAVATEPHPTTLTLGEFYARHTFHGPRLRAVDQVTEVGAGSIEGLIGTGADPSMTWLLAVDGALQLCAYWAVVHHGRIGLPVGVGELRLGGPIPAGARLTCRAALRRAEGDRFEGDLDLLGENGEPLVQIRGLRAEVLGVESPVVDSSTYRIAEFPEVKELQGKIDFARAAGIDIPYFRTLDACTGATAQIDGREYINFTSYNYVGLSGHPRISEAVAQAVKVYGTSVSASRVTGGQKPIHLELEQEIAQFLGTEASMVMVGGHATNVSVIGHLLGPEDLVLHDSLAHDSILGGAKLAGARRRPFPHNDYQAAERILREIRSSVRRVLIAVEGVYSMDGDITPLPQFINLRKKYGTMLFVDEAHSLGVLGATGRGVGEHYSVERRDVDMWMGTMSKTLSSCGGYIAGSTVLVEYLKYTVPGFIYSVGMSPGNTAAALNALRILRAEPERARTCQERSATFVRLCRERGIDTGMSAQSAVVPCIVGNSYASIRLAEGLLKRGIHVHPIIYPAVSETEARLRFFITAAHTEEQLRYTADALAEELARLSLLPKKVEAADAAEEGPVAREVS
jgi:8-amino-7-oxononanoate synthase